MKLAILHCKKATEVCTGASCFKAYNSKLKNFEQYIGLNTELIAFFNCGGCNIDIKTDRGMLEKIERLKKEGVEKIHIGVCITRKCPHFDDIISMLSHYNIPYEFGTH